MKRLAYIFILSAATVLLIVMLDIFSSKEDEAPSEEFIIEEVPDAGDPAELLKEPTLENMTIPIYETVLTNKGGKVRVQTSFFRIDVVKRDFGNQFAARGIRFTFYDKYDYEKPLEERIIAKGKADRAKLFSEGDDVGGEFKMEFKPEFVLEDNVEIDTFDSRTGSKSFSLLSNVLIYLEDRLDAKGRARIFNEEMSIDGEDLTFYTNGLILTIQKDISVEGRSFDFARALNPETPGESREPEEKKETKENQTPLHITARGTESGPPGLHLSLARKGMPESEPAALLAMEEEPLNRLTIRGDVIVTKDDLDFSCDELSMTFIELPDGQSEVRSFRGITTGEKRTVLHKGEEGYSVICDDFLYGKEEEGELFRILGKPIVDNLSIPLFSGPDEKDSPSLLLFHCGGSLLIKPEESSDPGETIYHITMEGGKEASGRVTILDKNDPGSPLLEADRMNFTVTMKEGASKESAASPTLNRFAASGAVSGRFDAFDIECTDFFWDSEKSPEGDINKLTLLDPTTSRLSSEEFVLESPEIDITLYPDLTEIKAYRTFLCTSVVENLPRFGSIDLFSSPGGPSDAAPPPAEGGEVKIQGEGELLRFLIREGEGLSSKNITISESPAFNIHVLRCVKEGGEKEEAIAIQGTHSFSLGIVNNELKSLKLERGRELVCPEMNFSALGDYLNLENRGSGGFAFHARADEGRATVSLSQPQNPEVCFVRARDVRILTGGEVRLDAEGDVDADVPLAWFKKEEEKKKEEAEEEGSPKASAKTTGTFKINSDTLSLQSPEGDDRFFLNARGNARIRRDEVGLITESETLDYDSASEILSLWGGRGNPTVIKVRSGESDLYNTITSRKVDINLGDSTVKIYRGGTIVFHPYEKKRNAHSRLEIQCDNEIALTGSLLELNGPVALEYWDASGDEHRSMQSGMLWINFVKSPFMATVFTKDLESYRYMIESGASGPPGEDENAIKRIKAQDNVKLNLEMKSEKYVVNCALLTWNILTDDILCDGLGKKIVIAINEDTKIRGDRIRIRPVNEEIEILNK